MKLSVLAVLLMIFWASYSLCFSQVNNHLNNVNPSLEDLSKQSDVIIEGEVIDAVGFRTTDNSPIYTSATIKITKIFKGTVSDSLVEIIIEGGRYGDIISSVSDYFSLAKGYDGLFFLTNNDTQNRLKKDLHSYIPFYGIWSYIKYVHGNMIVANHVAVSRGITYDDLEHDLFQRIEAATGQKRKIIGPNMFEIEAAKKAAYQK